jgi:hypothetical protein
LLEKDTCLQFEGPEVVRVEPQDFVEAFLGCGEVAGQEVAFREPVIHLNAVGVGGAKGFACEA